MASNDRECSLRFQLGSPGQYLQVTENKGNYKQIKQLPNGGAGGNRTHE